MDPDAFVMQIRLEEGKEAETTKKLEEMAAAEEELANICSQMMLNASKVEELEMSMIETYLNDTENPQEREEESGRTVHGEATSTTDGTDNGTATQPDMKLFTGKSIIRTPAEVNARNQAKYEQQVLVQERLAMFQGFKQAQQQRHEARQARVKHFVEEIGEEMYRCSQEVFQLAVDYDAFFWFVPVEES